MLYKFGTLLHSSQTQQDIIIKLIFKTKHKQKQTSDMYAYIG
jgi:hypothetical protein